jgi:hypothetical protein
MLADVALELMWEKEDAFYCMAFMWPEMRPEIERSAYRCVSHRHAIAVYYNTLGGRGVSEAAALASAGEVM